MFEYLNSETDRFLEESMNAINKRLCELYGPDASFHCGIRFVPEGSMFAYNVYTMQNGDADNEEGHFSKGITVKIPGHKTNRCHLSKEEE